MDKPNFRGTPDRAVPANVVTCRYYESFVNKPQV